MTNNISQNEINESLDHLFRYHSGQMVSVLSRFFGFEKIDLIEDAIQDAMIKALKQWSFNGIPNNPKAWLIEVSKNSILDKLRRSKKFEASGEEFENVSKYLLTLNFEDSVLFANEVSEDVLRMMFACCHPSISPDSQVALTLKTVSGFSVREISSAFLAKEETISKMLTRAKQKLKILKTPLEIPSPEELNSRLEIVLKVLYLMFNEGYNTSEGKQIIRLDLCFEAIRLAKLLVNNPLTSFPKVHALLALFLFQSARLNSRFDKNGEILQLAEQNRQFWDKKMISEGFKHFRLSAQGNELSNYHLEAEIASIHTFAKDFESTDWKRILHCYEILAKRKNSPVINLNKAVVVAKIEGSEKGLAILEEVKQNGELVDYLLFYITLGQFQFETGQNEKAMESYEQALKLTRNETSARFIQKKIKQISGF